MANPVQTPPILLNNPLRTRLAAIFALPYPLSSMLFRYYISRLIPFYKTMKIDPLVISDDETVIALDNHRKFRRQASNLHPGAILSLAQAAAEIGLIYQIEGVAKIVLDRMDMVWLQEIQTGVIARVEWTEKELTLLKKGNGKIDIGVVVVNKENELCAKAVFQFVWNKSKTNRE